MSDVFSLSPEEIDALAQGATLRTFPKNAVVVNEGDRTDSLYIILSGRVRVFVADEEGHEVTLGTQGAGEYFGEMVLDEGPRSASIMTLEPCRFAVVTREAFTVFLAAHPDFSVRLIRKLIHRARALTNNVRSLALLDVYGRVARLLLDLAVEQDGKRVIPERLTQQDIASRVGASREMISLILKDLSAGGYITVSGKVITVNKELPKQW
ncbi:MAG TPA: Crp/Fnr family transcriptional regulator [Burkholderiales bacterium]|nr:Crp/Fnr family transcriptional regulator [Burkholderiales bacterium]